MKDTLLTKPPLFKDLSAHLFYLHVYQSLTNMHPYLKTSVGSLNLFDTKLSPRRHWQRLRTHKVEEEGIYTYCYAVTTTVTLALRWAVMTAILMFHYL